MQSASKKTENSHFRIIETKSKTNNNTLQSNLNGCDQFSTLNGSVQKQETNRKKIFDQQPQSQSQYGLQSNYQNEKSTSANKTLYDNYTISDKYYQFKGAEIKQNNQQSAQKSNQINQDRNLLQSNQTNQNYFGTISYQEQKQENNNPTSKNFEHKTKNESNGRTFSSNNEYFKHIQEIDNQNLRSQYEITQVQPENKYKKSEQQIIPQSQQQERIKTEQQPSYVSNYQRFKVPQNQQLSQLEYPQNQVKNQINNGEKNNEQYVQRSIFSDQQQQNTKFGEYVFPSVRSKQWEEQDLKNIEYSKIETKEKIIEVKASQIQNSQFSQNNVEQSNSNLEQSKSKQGKNIFEEIYFEQNKSQNQKTLDLSQKQDQELQQDKNQTQNQVITIEQKNSINQNTQPVFSIQEPKFPHLQNKSIEQVQNQNHDDSEKYKIFTNIMLPKSDDDTQESDTQLQVSKYIDNNQNEQEIIAQEGSAEQLSSSKILSKNIQQHSDSKEKIFASASNTLQTLSENFQKPVKVSNFLSDRNQCQQIKQFQSNIKAQKNKINPIFNEQFTVLIKMNEERLNRKVDIEYVTKLLHLSETDCLTDIKSGKQKANIILMQFPLIRRVRGDGNCLYTSLVFPYLELLNRKKQFTSILNSFEAQEIFWENEVLIEIPMVYQLIRQIFIQLQKLSEQCGDDFNKFSQVLLHYFNKENGFYDLMIIFIRSIIIQSFKKYSKSEEYCNFILEDTLFKNIERIATFEEEGEFLEIQFFSEITQIKIKLINFSDTDPISQMQIVEPKVNINKSDTDKLNFITLKYNDGHYDILYSQMQKFVSAEKQLLEQNELLKIDFTPLY